MRSISPPATRDSRAPLALTAAALALSALVASGGAPAAARPAQAGTYVLAETWRSTAGELAPDAWRYAAGIDVTSAGRVYLSDRDEARLTVIEPGGAIRVLRPAADYDDQLVAPGHLAVDPAAGRLYVADGGADAVAVFDLDGTRLATWPNVAGAAGVAVAPDGSVVVGSGDTGEVHLYAAEGFRLATWRVVTPDANGELVRGIDVDARGQIYVVDGRQPQVHVLDAGGRPVDRLRVNLQDGQEVSDVAVDDGPGGGSRPIRYWVATTRSVMFQDTRAGTNWQIAPSGAAWAVALDPAYGIVATAPGRPGVGSRVMRFPYTQGTFVLPDRQWGSSLLLPGTLDGPEVVEVGADGGVYVLDRGNRVQRFSPGGRPVDQIDNEAENPSHAGAAADGTVFVTNGAAVMAFSKASGVWARTWRDTVAPPGRDDSQAVGMAYNAAAGQVALLDAEQDRLRRFSTAGQRGVENTLRGVDDSVVWADLAGDRAGNLYALDRTNRLVYAVAPDLTQRTVGLPAPARHIAMGPGGELFALDRDGWVRRYDVSADPARRTAAFDATRFDVGLETAPSDLAVDAAGDVYVTDRKADVVSRFTWDGAARAEEPPAADVAQCRNFPDKTASPAQVRLGASVEVRLTVRGGCGAAASNTPRDIVLVLDVSGSMQGEKIRILREAAVNFIAEVDFTTSRVGLVSFTDTGRVEQALTTSAPALRQAIRRLDADPNGGTAVDEGLIEAHQHWLPRRRAEAKAVFILLSDGGSALGPARDAARAAKDDGVEIFTIGIQAWRLLMQTVATDLDHYFEADSARFLYGIFEQIAERVTVSTLFRAITITDRIPANMQVVAGSAVPPATHDPATGTLTWTLADVPPAGLALRYELRPQAVGEWPTNVAAWGDFTDGFGTPGRLDFPVPRVRVFEDAVPTDPPSATATRTATPTATPTASATPTATPTITPSPRPTVPPEPIFIPIALKEKPCVPTDRHADVVLVIDTSSSMVGEKIAAAKAAARGFVDLLKLPGDQAGVVGFNRQATLASGLTSSAAAAKAAIDGLATEPGTRIDVGLEAAVAELGGPRRRADNTPTIVLLTDGQQDAEPDRPIAIAAAARAAGKVIFAVGLGSDVDAVFLERLAGVRGRTFLAPGPGDLGRIYAQIAGQVPCPPEVYWGARP